MCNVSSIIFADDPTFFYSGNDLKEVCKTISDELDKLSIWFQVNRFFKYRKNIFYDIP